MPLTRDAKHKALMGFQRGLGLARHGVTLLQVDKGGNDSMIFAVRLRERNVLRYFTIRSLYNGKQWIGATMNAYLSGDEAGNQAAKWYFERGQDPDLLDTVMVKMDEDLKEWMVDA